MSFLSQGGDVQKMLMLFMVLALAAPAVAQMYDPCNPSGTCPTYIPSDWVMEHLDREERELRRIPDLVRSYEAVPLPPTTWEDHIIPVNPQGDSLFPWAVQVTGRQPRSVAASRTKRYVNVWISLNPWREFNFSLRTLAARKNIQVPEPGEPLQLW